MELLGQAGTQGQWEVGEPPGEPPGPSSEAVTNCLCCIGGEARLRWRWCEHRRAGAQVSQPAQLPLGWLIIARPWPYPGYQASWPGLLWVGHRGRLCSLTGATKW